jgi:hypothetical protein
MLIIIINLLIDFSIASIYVRDEAWHGAILELMRETQITNILC